MKKNKGAKRQQAPKGRNVANMQAHQERLRSNAAGAHRSEKDYRRKPKHFKGWDQ